MHKRILKGRCAASRFAKPVVAALLIVLIFGTVTVGLPAVRASTSNFPSFLTISQGRLVGSQGERVYLDGVNYKDQLKWWLLYQKGGKVNWGAIERDFEGMALLKVKAVRLWIPWTYYEPVPGQLDSGRLMGDIQRMVDMARRNGLYIILVIYVKDIKTELINADNWLQAHATTDRGDPESKDFWLNDGDFPIKQRSYFIEFWREISSRFKDEPAIAAYNLINEPYNKYYEQLPQWATSVPDHDLHYPLKSLYDLTIAAIRANGDSHIIILDYNWAYTYSEVPLAKPSKDPLLLYDVHIYATASPNPVQGWDVTHKTGSPWKGKAPNGTDISYAYPDTSTRHDKLAIAERFRNLARVQQQGYLFLVGEFGFTENSGYNLDVANLVVQFDFAGFLYFEYSPDESIGTFQLIQPMMSIAR